MSKRKKSGRSLANPTQLAPFDENDRVVVIIETPKGSRNKYAFDPKERLFELKRVLPAGMAFPYYYNHSYAHVKHIDDLGKPFEREIEAFFVSYHRLSGKQYRILGLKGPSAARRCIEKGCQ